MYLKENVIKLLHMKNVIFIIVSVFSILVCGTYIISEFTYYMDDIEYALEAVSMKSSIIWIIISAVLLVLSAVSRSMIKKAAFYSSFFDGDLDGFVEYSNIAAVTGKKPSTVKSQLAFFRFIYMKNYRLTKKDNADIVELYSKKLPVNAEAAVRIWKKEFSSQTPAHTAAARIYLQRFSQTTDFTAFPAISGRA